MSLPGTMPGEGEYLDRRLLQAYFFTEGEKSWTKPTDSYVQQSIHSARHTTANACC